MSLKFKTFTLARADGTVQARKQALLERHHRAIEEVLDEAKSLSIDSQRKLEGVHNKRLRSVAKR